jgi:uncharacterized membrane protein
MPAHVAVVHLVIALAPLTAVLALVYAAFAGTRRGTRWPLVGCAVATAVLVVIAGEVGATLLDEMKARGPAADVAAATEHGHNSGSLALAAFALLGIVLVGVWWVLRPERPASLGSRIAAGLLALSAVAVLVTTWTTVVEALDVAWTASGRG